MELVKEGDHILYVWGGEINSNIEEQVNKLKLKENVKVNVENAERLSLGMQKIYIKNLCFCKKHFFFSYYSSHLQKFNI